MNGLIKDYASNSSAHGLPRLAKADSPRGKSFWAIVCLLALCFLALLGTSLLRKYYAFPKSVRLEVANQPVPFPAVSLCNLRPLDIYTTWKIIFDEKGMHRWNMGEDFLYRGRNVSSTPAFESHLINYVNIFKAYQSYAYVESNGDPVEFYQLERNLRSRMTMIANLNLTAARQAGVSKEQFIAKCQYGGQSCDHRNFSLFQDPAYLNCFTFNLSKHKDSIYEGPDNGLSVVLFAPGPSIMGGTAEQQERLALGHQELGLGGEGVRLVVHEQDTVPYPLTEGMDVPRGTAVSIAIKLVEHDRLGPPHGNCTDRKTIDGFIKYSYTMASCKKTCLQQLVMEECGCADVSLPIWKTNLSLCSSFDTLPSTCRGKSNVTQHFERCAPIFQKWYERMECKRSTRSNISQNLSAWTTCDCLPRCHDSEYQISYSMSDWPMREQQREVVQELLYVDRFIHNFPPDKQKQYFGKIDVRNNLKPSFEDYKNFVQQKNLIRLNIYISDTSVVRIMETEAYSLTHLASDVGGQLSLWLGVSIISLVEALELLGALCRACCNKRSTNNDKPVPV